MVVPLTETEVAPWNGIQSGQHLNLRPYGSVARIHSRPLPVAGQLPSCISAHVPRKATAARKLLLLGPLTPVRKNTYEAFMKLRAHDSRVPVHGYGNAELLEPPRIRIRAVSFCCSAQTPEVRRKTRRPRPWRMFLFGCANHRGVQIDRYGTRRKSFGSIRRGDLLLLRPGCSISHKDVDGPLAVVLWCHRANYRRVAAQ